MLEPAKIHGISVVIPARNEQKRLPRTLDIYLPALETSKIPFEIVIVADDCHDGTVKAAEPYSARGVRLLEFSRRLGKGGAIIAGLQSTKYDRVGFLDADGSILPADFLRMVEALDDIDCVVASRRLRSSRITRRQSWGRRILGRGWNFLARAILRLPVSDTQCGAKFFRSSVVTPLLNKIGVTSWAFDVDLLYHIRKAGHPLFEIPVTWRNGDDSQLRALEAAPRMLVSLLAIRLMNSPIGQKIPGRFVHSSVVRWRG